MTLRPNTTVLNIAKNISDFEEMTGSDFHRYFDKHIDIYRYITFLRAEGFSNRLDELEADTGIDWLSLIEIYPERKKNNKVLAEFIIQDDATLVVFERLMDSFENGTII